MWNSMKSWATPASGRWLWIQVKAQILIQDSVDEMTQDN